MLLLRSLREVSVVFIGSLLLFLLQPIAGQRLLAAYGGSPAVWLSCLLFFQFALLLGYAWGFFITRFPLVGQVLLQSWLLTGAVIYFLPLDVRGQPWGLEKWLPVEWEPLAVFTSLCGDLLIPIVALASVSPVIQSWGSRVAGRRPPYWLYAYSNLASLIALAAYPFWIQIEWDVAVQLQMATRLFQAFGLMFLWNMIAILWSDFFSKPEESLEVGRETGNASYDSGSERRPRRITWVVASLLPALLLMSLSNQIGSDVAAGPVFWTLPLATYLATFTLAFSYAFSTRWLAPIGMLGLLVVVVCPILTPWVSAELTIGLACGGLFAAAWGIHQVLANTQPGSQQLPSYYLLLSAGGMLAGVFSSLLAPLLFTNYYELELAVLLGAGFLCWEFLSQSRDATEGRPKAAIQHRLSRSLGRPVRFVLYPLMLLVIFVSAIGLIRKWPIRQTGSKQTLLVQERTFHGVLRVLEKESAQGTVRTFGHGWTDHGRRLMNGPWALYPSGYYASHSGLAAAFNELRRSKSDGLTVCVMGLGAGNLLNWKASEDRFQFIEIDPQVIQLQETFFPHPQQDQRVDFLAGDGRQYLQETLPWTYDLIVMDAFTGDSVPTHLLTRQAMETYLQACRLDGVLAIHISNRYLDFVPVLQRHAELLELEMVTVVSRPPNAETQRLLAAWETMGVGPAAGVLAAIRQLANVETDPRESHWVLLSRVPFSAGLREIAATGEQGSDVGAEAVRWTASGDDLYEWTDDYTPIFPLIK